MPKIEVLSSSWGGLGLGILVQGLRKFETRKV